jgi:hypothetical protein
VTFVPAAVGASPGNRAYQLIHRMHRPKTHLLAGRKRALQMNVKSSDDHSIGLVASPGSTGSCAANLWPIPIIGSYGWTLFVWKRADLRGNAVSVHVQDTSATKLAIAIAPSPAKIDSSAVHRTVKGILTGDYNVASFLEDLQSSSSRGYRLIFQDRPSSNFLSLTSEIAIQKSSICVTSGRFWIASHLQFRNVETVTHSPSKMFHIYEVRLFAYILEFV